MSDVSWRCAANVTQNVLLLGRRERFVGASARAVVVVKHVEQRVIARHAINQRAPRRWT